MCLTALPVWGQLSQFVTSINVSGQGTNPECVLADQTRGYLYVSLHNTQAGAVDGAVAVYNLSTYAFVKIFSNGGILIDPMGMAVIGNYLYVTNSDLTSAQAGNIVRIEIATGTMVPGGASVVLTAGSNYYDLTTDGTYLWASSILITNPGNMYRFTNMVAWPAPTASNTALTAGSQGNGIILGASPDIYVADFSGGSHSGYVQAYNRTTGVAGTLWNFSGAGGAAMDGLAWSGAPGTSDLYATDWGTKVYMRKASDGVYSALITGFSHAADIDIDTTTQRLYVADMTANVVKVYTNSTAIQLLFFKGQVVEDHVSIIWETASELDNAGFYLWKARGSVPGVYTKVTGLIIPAQGGPSWGAKYDFQDFEIQKGKTYWYKLEDVSNQGTSTFHEPVRVDVK